MRLWDCCSVTKLNDGHVAKPTKAGQNWPRRRVLTSLLGATAGLAGLAAPAFGSVLTASNSDLIGRMKTRILTGRDTLLDVARSLDLGILELSAANPGVDAWVPGEERLIVLPTAHLVPNGVERDGIIVNLSELRLYYFPPQTTGADGTAQVATSAIGIGRDGFDTPVGKSHVVRKKANPTWYPTAATRADKPELPEIVGPGPDNPLGAHAIYLGWPTYLIHGTNKPLGVGRRISRGCIRMYPERVEALFGMVPVNAKVQVVEQSTKLGWHEGELYLEAHPDFDQLDELEASYRFEPKTPIDMRDEIIAFAGNQAKRINWAAVRTVLTARRGFPEPITGRASGYVEDIPLPDKPANTGGPRALFPRT